MKDRQGLVLIIVPLTPLKHHLTHYPAPEWVRQEVYLNPNPKLMLRNQVRTECMASETSSKVWVRWQEPTLGHDSTTWWEQRLSEAASVDGGVCSDASATAEMLKRMVDERQTKSQNQVARGAALHRLWPDGNRDLEKR